MPHYDESGYGATLRLCRLAFKRLWMKGSIELAAEYKRFGVANGFGETSIHKDLLSVLS